MQALLDGLTPRDRSMIIMRYWEDMSYQEIAEATGDTVDAVKSRLHRARSVLGTMLDGGARRQAVPARRPGPRPRRAAAAPPHGRSAGVVAARQYS